MSESEANVTDDQRFAGAAADAVRRLDELDTLPVAAHPDVFERLHAELHAALTNAEPESSGSREPE